MAGIALRISYLIDQREPDGSLCHTCGQTIIDQMNKLYLSVDNSLSAMAFELIDTNKQFCKFCKPEL